MSSTRPVTVDDAIVEGRHIEAAAEVVATADRRDHDRTARGVGAAATFVAAATATIAAATASVVITSAAVVIAAACVAGYTTMRRNERDRTRRRYARSVAYLEALRGTDISTDVSRWAATNATTVWDTAENISEISAIVGADRTHQLLVRAHRGHDYSIFNNLNTARRVSGGTSNDDATIAVVNRLNSEHGEFPGPTELAARLAASADRRRRRSTTAV